MSTSKFLTAFLLVTISVLGQQTNKLTDNKVNFDALVKKFKTSNYDKEIIKPPFIHKGYNYKIIISDKPIAFSSKEIVLKNPFDSTYPISYSIIYQDKLVSLFENGSFVCHSISTMDRDEVFEKKLNSKKFQYHWLLDNKLVAISDDKYYYLNPDNIWLNYDAGVPFKNQPKLFEDSTYICFCDCFGEWGGTVYFYNKTTKKTHFTKASCANSIIKKANKYYVLSEGGHGDMSVDLAEILFPDSLTSVDLNNYTKRVPYEALGYTDSSGQAKTIFNYWGIGFSSSFIYNSRTIYLVHWRYETFLAEMNNNILSIVNPFLNNAVGEHYPLTTKYNNSILINSADYGTAKKREVSCILIVDNQIINLNWNKRKDHKVYKLEFPK